MDTISTTALNQLWEEFGSTHAYLFETAHALQAKGPASDPLSQQHSKPQLYQHAHKTFTTERETAGHICSSLPQHLVNQAFLERVDNFWDFANNPVAGGSNRSQQLHHLLLSPACISFEDLQLAWLSSNLSSSSSESGSSSSMAPMQHPLVQETFIKPASLSIQQFESPYNSTSMPHQPNPAQHQIDPLTNGFYLQPAPDHTRHHSSQSSPFADNEAILMYASSVPSSGQGRSEGRRKPWDVCRCFTNQKRPGRMDHHWNLACEYNPDRMQHSCGLGSCTQSFATNYNKKRHWAVVHGVGPKVSKFKRGVQR
ncbi:hypothetical protein FRB94_007844 [Tulasnella sp. JGI-2019a]|nr:hypothetical protein FRB94_007844 [Tulasnella sp. JGI-2019a]